MPHVNGVVICKMHHENCQVNFCFEFKFPPDFRNDGILLSKVIIRFVV